MNWPRKSGLATIWETGAVAGDGDRLGRLEGALGAKLLAVRCNCGNGKGIEVPVFNSFAEEGDLFEQDRPIRVRSIKHTGEVRESGRALPRTITHPFAKARKDGAPDSWAPFRSCATWPAHVPEAGQGAPDLPSLSSVLFEVFLNF